jgi:hypothetical protein
MSPELNKHKIKITYQMGIHVKQNQIVWVCAKCSMSISKENFQALI